MRTNDRRSLIECSGQSGTRQQGNGRSSGVLDEPGVIAAKTDNDALATRSAQELALSDHASTNSMKHNPRDKSQKDVSDDGDDQEALDEEDGHDGAPLVREQADHADATAKGSNRG